MESKLSYYCEMGRKMRPWRMAPKVFNYLKFRCLPRKAVTPLGRYSPQIASLLVTLRCNLDCGYCSAGKIILKDEEKWRRSEATLEKVKHVFSNPLFKNCLLVDLQGGEPLLVSDFADIVAYLAKGGRMVNTSTNGLLLADRIVDLKKAGISRINVSLYDANRAVIERNIERINRIFPVHASIVLLRSEVENKPDRLLETARFLRDAGCRSLRFWIYRPMGLDPKPEEIISGDLPAYVEFRKRADKALPGFCLWPAAFQTGKAKKLCPQLWQRAGCDMSGNMIICCGTNDPLPGQNGNLFTGEPEAIFNHPVITAMREKLIDPESEPPDVCKTCNLLGEPGW